MCRNVLKHASVVHVGAVLIPRIHMYCLSQCYNWSKRVFMEKSVLVFCAEKTVSENPLLPQQIVSVLHLKKKKRCFSLHETPLESLAHQCVVSNGPVPWYSHSYAGRTCIPKIFSMSQNEHDSCRMPHMFHRTEGRSKWGKLMKGSWEEQSLWGLKSGGGCKKSFPCLIHIAECL